MFLVGVEEYLAVEGEFSDLGVDQAFLGGEGEADLVVVPDGRELLALAEEPTSEGCGLSVRALPGGDAAQLGGEDAPVGRVVGCGVDQPR